MKQSGCFVVISAALTFLSGAPFVHAQASTPQAEVSPVASTMALTSGTCLNVSDGDVLTFEWNPSFDNAAAVTGLREFTLRFAGAADGGVARRTQGGLALTAVNRREGDLHPFKALPNGFYQVTFHVHLKSSEPGEYHLVESLAMPQVDPEYKGKIPEMTNNPSSSSFCLNVLAHASRGRD